MINNRSKTGSYLPIFTSKVNFSRSDQKCEGGCQGEYNGGWGEYDVGGGGQQNNLHGQKCNFASCSHENRLWFLKTVCSKCGHFGSLVVWLQSMQSQIMLSFKKSAHFLKVLSRQHDAPWDLISSLNWTVWKESLFQENKSLKLNSLEKQTEKQHTSSGALPLCKKTGNY